MGMGIRFLRHSSPRSRARLPKNPLFKRSSRSCWRELLFLPSRLLLVRAGEPFWHDRIETMIKGISLLRPATTPADYERLSGFFSALGFAPGNGWIEEKSRGALFLAPSGRFEIVDGEMPSTADVLVEVTQIDAVREAVIAWFRSHNEEPASRVTAVTDTDWKSKMFTAEPVKGQLFSFWEWSDPFKGKPVAVEGDL